MNSLGIILFWCATQVTLLALVAGAVYFAGRRLGPATGAFVSLAALLLMTVITAFAISPWPTWLPAIELQLAQSTSDAASDPGALGDPNAQATAPTSAPRPATTGESPLAAATKAFWQQIRNPSEAPVAASTGWSWWSLVTMVFLSGVLFGSIRLVIGLWSVNRYRRGSRPVKDAKVLEMVDILAAQLGCTRTIEVRENHHVPGAATIGWLHPLILLPPNWREWNATERHAVLAHEVAHIHHADYLTWLLAQVGLVLHFYHPLAHWFCRCLRLDQELIADAEAARLVGGRQTYLQSLAQIALRQADAALSWPAQTFLPTRRTFLRRIEMLRDSKEKWLAHAPKSARWIAAIVLISTGLVVLGLRGPAGSGSGIVRAQQPATPRGGQVAPLGLAHIPRDAVAVIGLRPATLLQRPAAQPLTAMLQNMGNLEKDWGVAPSQVESLHIVLVSPIDARGPGPFAFVIRLANAESVQTLAAHLGPRATKEVYGTQTFFRQDPNSFYYQPDERTIVFANSDAILHRCIVAGSAGASSAKWASAWGGVASGDVAAIVNTAAVRQILTPAMAQFPDAARVAFSAYAPLWEKSEVAVAGLQISDSLNLHVVSTSLNDDDAKRVSSTLTAAVTMTRNSLTQARNSAANSRAKEGALLLGAIDIVDELLETLKVTQSKNTVTVDVKATTENTARLVSTLVPAVSSARSSARRQVSSNNLKHIALAFHNFHDAHGRFPPAVTLGPNQVPRSWRVELLPYLDAANLYEQYRKDEPWDSENNKKVLAQMPAVFRHPADNPDSTNSSYFVITGNGTVFDGAEGRLIADITDGTSNTILAVDAKLPIPWTKPEDISYAADKPLAKFGGFETGGFSAAICDGSVRFISEKLGEQVLRLLITRSDGQPIPNF